MTGEYCPPLWSVAAYGLCAFLSLVMTGYLLHQVTLHSTSRYAPVAIIFLVFFGIIILLSVFRFARCHPPW